jgi:integrase
MSIRISLPSSWARLQRDNDHRGNQMDWFERVTGFPEKNYDETRAKLSVEGHQLQSVVNGKSYGIGELELVPLQTLRERAKVAGGLPGRLGIDIPTPDEIRAIIRALDDEKWRRRWRPLILTAVFTGLRASELRGLRWKDVDPEYTKIQVRQRMDRYGKKGPPKSKAGRRTVPLTPKLVAVLREWKLACPKGADGLVFPNGVGKVESHANIVNRCWWPLQVAAGVADVVKDADGKVVLGEDGEPVRKPRYTGLHALRHFYASWCINTEAAGGLGLPPKTVQTRLGHSSLAMTMDTYGHLFPDDDHTERSAAGEKRLWG